MLVCYLTRVTPCPGSKVAGHKAGQAETKPKPSESDPFILHPHSSAGDNLVIALFHCDGAGVCLLRETSFFSSPSLFLFGCIMQGPGLYVGGLVDSLQEGLKVGGDKGTRFTVAFIVYIVETFWIDILLEPVPVTRRV